MFGEGDSSHEISNAEKLEILQLIKEAGWEDAAALSKLPNLTAILEREKDYSSRRTSLASILSLKKEEPLPPPKYVTGLDLVLILLVLSLTTFLIALDNAIVATAIPKITDEFNSLSDAGWYGSAYLVTSCTLTLLYGRLYTFFSVKKVYLLAITLFEIGSLICGVAPNSIALIIGRAIAGLGGAGIFSGSTIILAHSVPMEKRAPLQGLLGAAFSVASAAGPLIGGAFADKLTWRWSFYINLPIGFFAVVIIYLYFQDPTANRNAKGTTFFGQLQKCDLIGTALFTPAVICLLVLLQFGGVQFAWNSPLIIALICVSVVLLIAFVATQIWKGDEASVPPRIICQRTVYSSAWYTFWLGAAPFVLTYYLPIWFQSIQGKSATTSGLLTLPFVLSTVIFSIAAGWLAVVVGSCSPLMVVGSILCSIGAAMLAVMTPSSRPAVWIGWQIMFGTGLGLGQGQPPIVVQVALPIQDVPTGVSIMFFLQKLGAAISVAVGETIFQSQLRSGIARILPGFDVKTILNAGATTLQQAVPKESLSQVVSVFSNSVTSSFWISTFGAALSILGAVAIGWKRGSMKAMQAAPVPKKD